MKYKRLIIILGSLFSLIVLCTILSFTLFKVNKIEFDFENSTSIFASIEKQTEVIKSADINTKIPIFTLNKKYIKNNLESNNPYLKVINIETVFPNKLILHCAEREELFCIKSRDNLYFICDEELKILNIQQSYSNLQTNAVLVNDVDILNTGASVGDFLELYSGQELIKNISSAFAHTNKTVADIKAIFKSVSLKYEDNVFVAKKSPTFTFTTFDNFEIEVRNANSFLNSKINILLNYVPELYEYYSTNKFIIDINPNNIDEIVTLLERA